MFRNDAFTYVLFNQQVPGHFADPRPKIPGPNDKYIQRYLQMMNRVRKDYDHPKPRFPFAANIKLAMIEKRCMFFRERDGSHGGTWRHIREVYHPSGDLGCFVDGEAGSSFK